MTEIEHIEWKRSTLELVQNHAIFIVSQNVSKNCSLSGIIFVNASIIFWNSWRRRKNFENIYDWCCLLNAYMRLIDYFGMTFASILACVLCRLLSQTWLMPKIMTSQKFRLWLLLQIASMSGTKDRESWWLLLFVSTFWDTLKKSEFMIEILMKERYVPKIIVKRAYDKMTM